MASQEQKKSFEWKQLKKAEKKQQQERQQRREQKRNWG